MALPEPGLWCRGRGLDHEAGRRTGVGSHRQIGSVTQNAPKYAIANHVGVLTSHTLRLYTLRVWKNVYYNFRIKYRQNSLIESYGLFLYNCCHATIHFVRYHLPNAGGS